MKVKLSGERQCGGRDPKHLSATREWRFDVERHTAVSCQLTRQVDFRQPWICGEIKTTVVIQDDQYRRVTSHAIP
jgi:hypothetical protein